MTDHIRFPERASAFTRLMPFCSFGPLRRELASAIHHVVRTLADGDLTVAQRRDWQAALGHLRALDRTMRAEGRIARAEGRITLERASARPA